MWACHDRHLTFAINSATIKINDEKEKRKLRLLVVLRLSANTPPNVNIKLWLTLNSARLT